MRLLRTPSVIGARRFAIPAFLSGAAILPLALGISAVPAQQKKKPPPPAAQAAAIVPAPALTRTTSRHEVRRFGYGGALTVYGAPQGAISIEGWSKSEIDITADIELRADTEDDLTRLAAVNNFLFDAEPNHIRIVSTGTHDRKYMKRVARDFPKKLLMLPWKIDYRIRVPVAIDLEIYAGRGALTLSGVEGAIRINGGGESSAPSSLLLTGGDVKAIVERGPLNVRIASRSWRGRGAEVRLASGDLTVELPANLNAELDVEVLRAGRIENSYPSLIARDERLPATERLQRLRAGSGGAPLSFIVGDGTLRIKQESSK